MSSGGNKAARKAQAQQEELETRKNEVSAQVNALFTPARRNWLYDRVKSDVFNYGKNELDTSLTDARKQTGFNLVRSGLSGGSADIDAQGDLNRRYNQALGDLGVKSQKSYTDAKTADENTRLGLLQSIQAGVDGSSILAAAAGQQSANIDTAKQQNIINNLGSALTVASNYRNNQTEELLNPGGDMGLQVGGKTGGKATTRSIG